MTTKTADETYVLKLLTALRCASPETLAALLGDVGAVKGAPWKRDMVEQEVADAADTIFGFGCQLYGRDEFTAICEAANVQASVSSVLVTYVTRQDQYKVTLPGGEVYRYAMIQNALRVAAEQATRHNTTVTVVSTANPNDTAWAELFLSGQRN